ncbi:MAG: glutamate--cysteine ligase, partial [Gammaproteobacteria bacterium]|nr:glutamate--cysteine ligase [Gammaproteobacteria bacterium]
NMLGICEQLDGSDPGRPYSSVLRRQLEVIADPSRTPSAMMLAEMQKNGEGFFSFAQRMSLQHKQFFDGWNLSQQRQQLFEEEVKNSLESQAAIEDADEISFEQFLQDYFRQT